MGIQSSDDRIGRGHTGQIPHRRPQGPDHQGLDRDRRHDLRAARSQGPEQHELVAAPGADEHERRRHDEPAGITRQTAHDYEQLFVNLRVVEHVPTWTSNRLKRLVRAPKRYLVDAALGAGAIGVDIDGVMRSGDLLGRVVDTFVTSQLRAELPLGRRRPRLFHIRDADGRHEVDLVAEFGGQQLVAIEIKADATPRPSAARHLAWLRDQVGDQFVAGVVFHTGRRVYPLGDRLVAAPIAAIWT